MKSVTGDVIRYWHEPVLGGIDLLDGECLNYRFGRHAHAEFVVAIIEQGAEQFETEKRSVIAPAGSVLIIPPAVAHTGRAATADGFTYRAFYPSIDLVKEIAVDMFSDSDWFKATSVELFQNTRLFAQIARAHQAFATSSSLDQTAELVAALRMLLVCSNPRGKWRTQARESRKISIAREYIDSHYGDSLNGTDIAAVVGLSVPHLMRAFSAHMNVPINVYLNTVRLSHARRQLLDGDAAANVAVNVGFNDQSHLIRRFREAFGVTPGQYIHDSDFRK